MFKFSFQQWQYACTVVTTGSLQKFRPGETYGMDLFLISLVLLKVFFKCTGYAIVVIALDDAGKNVK